MREKIGISLYPGLPEQVKQIVEVEGSLVSQNWGEYGIYELPLYRIEEIQAIMQHHIGAVEV